VGPRGKDDGLQALEELRRRAAQAEETARAALAGAALFKGVTMDKLFWLLPGKLAGRPGPDLDPWDLPALRAAGIGAILSVNDGCLCVPEAFTAAGIAYACVPFSDTAPPRPGDEEHCRKALPRAYAFVQAELARDHGVVVHCTAGKDRTGLFLSYFLIHHQGLSADAAIREVRRVRPVALSATGWEEFARRVLARFERGDG
jgi:hypothetical protein